MEDKFIEQTQNDFGEFNPVKEEDKFTEQIQNDFGNWGKTFTPKDLISEVKKSLSEHNFNRNNSRLVFSVCPDDINRIFERDTVENALKDQFDGEFHLGGLGGYPIGGVSGLTAASHHVPDNVVNGERKTGNMILFVSPHTGLSNGESFIYGKVIRPGHIKPSSSCGAMIGFLNALKQCQNPQEFSIPGDDLNVDPTRVVLHQELINNHSDELSKILEMGEENQQVIALAKLNYDLVMEKTKLVIKKFLEKETFKGNIVIIGGITVNHVKGDKLVLKEIVYQY